MSVVAPRVACSLQRAGQLVVSLLALSCLTGSAALSATAAAAAATERSYPVGELIEEVATVAHPDQQYALYLPTGYASGEGEWPVLLVLDPRGRAVPGVERFLPAAETHGYVVLSSYQSRSDTLREVNVAALNALLLEIQQYFRADMNRIYLAGMSGTAHASWRFAQFLDKHVAGVIAAGGGVQTSTQGPPGEAAFAYYGIAGTADFNYQELLRLEEHLLAEGVAHRIAIFEGRHGWPPHEFTNRALDWMQLQAVRQKLAPADPALIDAELAAARQAAAEADEPLMRLRRHRDVARDFAGLRDVSANVEAAQRLEADAATARRRATEKKLASAERAYLTTRYGRWVPRLRDTDQRPPSVKEALLELRVESLRKQAEDPANPPQAHSAQRTLENLYVGVAFYFPQEFERSGDQERLVRSLEIATAIFPDRARGQWRLAAAYVQARRPNAALATLRAATSLGFVDLERLETDPTWEPLRARPEWAALIESLTRRPDPGSAKTPLRP